MDNNNKTEVKLPFDFQEYFERKERIEKELSDELNKERDKLLSLVPADIYDYISGLLNREDWLYYLYKNTLNIVGGNNDKIKNVRDYELKSIKSALFNLKLLKEAWKDVIKVKAKYEPQDGYIYVSFKLVMIKKKK